MDADGGRGRVGTRMRCMCVRMDCLQTQISVKKKRKEKRLTCRHTWMYCVCVRMRCVRKCWCADADDCKKEKKRKWKARKGNLLNTNPGTQICVVCACGCVAC